jgi:hypothetical protein
MSMETEKIGGNSQEELEEDQGSDTVDAATVVVAQHHRPVGYDGEEQHLAHDQAHHHAWEMLGLQACLPTGDGGGDSAADAEKKSRSPSKAEPEWIE